MATLPPAAVASRESHKQYPEHYAVRPSSRIMTATPVRLFYFIARCDAMLPNITGVCVLKVIASSSTRTEEPQRCNLTRQFGDGCRLDVNRATR